MVADNCEDCYCFSDATDPGTVQSSTVQCTKCGTIVQRVVNIVVHTVVQRIVQRIVHRVQIYGAYIRCTIVEKSHSYVTALMEWSLLFRSVKTMSVLQIYCCESESGLYGFALYYRKGEIGSHIIAIYEDSSLKSKSESVIHYRAVKAARSEAFHVSVLEVIHENKWWGRCRETCLALFRNNCICQYFGNVLEIF